MRTRVQMISSYTLGGLESQINEFLQEFPTYRRDLIDIKFLETHYDKLCVAMVIYAEEE